MLYIKKDTENKWLIYFNNYKPTEGKLVLFKTINDTNLEEKVFLPASIVERDSFNIYKFFETSEENENLEEGRVYYSQGGYYNLEIYEDDAYTTTPTGNTVYTERVWIDLFIQTVSCLDYVYTTGSTVYVSPSNTIIERTNMGEYLPLSGGTMNSPSDIIWNGTGGTTFGIGYNTDLLYFFTPYTELRMGPDEWQYQNANGNPINYGLDYSDNYVDRSLIDKGYADRTYASVISVSTTYDPVISILNTPPNSPSEGDRYLIGSGATDVWTGNDNAIAEWNGTNWVYTTPILNANVFVTDTLSTYRFDGDVWILYPGLAVLHNGNAIGGALKIGTLDNNDIEIIRNQSKILTLNEYGIEFNDNIEQRYIGWDDYNTGIVNQGNSFYIYKNATNVEFQNERINVFNTDSNFDFEGIVYGEDYSANYTDRSLVDKGYVDAAISNINPDLSGYLPLSGGTMTGDITFSANPNSGLNFGESYLDFDIRYDKNSESLVIKGNNTDNGNTNSIYVGINSLYLYSNKDLFLDADKITAFSSTNASFSGITYFEDYSANYTDRSLVDKAYVDNNCITRFEDGYKQTFADKVNYDTLSAGNGSTQVVAGFCLIKGGSMGPNGFIDMWGTLENELNASKLANCNVRFGASVNLPTRNAAVPAEYTTLATYTFTTTQRSMNMERRLVNVGSESVQKIYPTGSNTANKTGAINLLLSSPTIDTSQDWYLIFTVQSAEPTDFFRFIKLTGETTYIS
jgi:hypothetical protein